MAAVNAVAPPLLVVSATPPAKPLLWSHARNVKALATVPKKFAAGTAPDAPEVRRRVARMDGLATQFSGGDQELSAGVRAAWHDDPAEQADSWWALSEYLDLARQHTHSKEQKHV